MTNEEFQKVVLEELKSIKTGQEELKKGLNAVIEQTADLTEFREETNEKFDILIEDNKSIHGILGEHEVSIRSLRRRSI